MKKNTNSLFVWILYCIFIFFGFIIIAVPLFSILFSLLLLISNFIIKFENKNWLLYTISIGVPIFSIYCWFILKSNFGLIIANKLWILMNHRILTIKHLNMYIELKNKIKKECIEYKVDIENHCLLKKIDKIIINYLNFLK